MPNSIDTITNGLMGVKLSSGDELQHLIRKIDSDQSLEQEYYRQKFCDLAIRLNQEKTGHEMKIKDHGVLLAKEYYVDPEDGEDVETEYEAYGFNSSDYAICRTRVLAIISTHRANQLWNEIQDSLEGVKQSAADRGYPSNLTFEKVTNHNKVPICQTWVINHEGQIRPFDYSAVSADGLVCRERLEQVLPGDIIATWQQKYPSAPHFFGLEIYSERLPQQILSEWDHVTVKHWSGEIYSLKIDTVDQLESAEIQDTIFHMLTPAQIETLAELQIDIAKQNHERIDPIRFDCTPGIQDGWLGIMGVKQVIPLEVFQEDKEE